MSRLNTFDRYEPGRELPLGGYMVLAGAYGLLITGALWKMARRAPSGGPRGRDLVTIGVATYQLSRMVAKDRVLAPFRAPFTSYQESGGAGELKETSRGSGLQKAIGDLLTCPYCLGPWIGGALSTSMVLQPRATRWVTGVLTSVAMADVCQQLYAALKKSTP